jgi:ABC-type glycerol-3-phosphate transport system substrate-binding protein
VDVEAVKSALELWNTMIHTDQSVPPDMPQKDMGNGFFTIGCGKSKAALSLVPLSSLMHQPQYAGLKIAPLPAAPPNRPGTIGGIEAYGISAKAADPEAAWTFLSFLAGPEGATILAKQGRFPVYSTDSTQAAWLASAPPPPPGSEALFRTSWSGEPLEYTPATPRGTFLIGARDLFLGKTTIDEAVHKYEAALAKSK